MKPLLAAGIGGVSPYLITLAKDLIASKTSQQFSDFFSPLLFSYYLSL